jgi:hypothetical protein
METRFMPGGAAYARTSRTLLVFLCLLLSSAQMVSATPIRVPGPSTNDATPTVTAVVPPPTPTPSIAFTPETITFVSRPKPASAPFDNPNGTVTKSPTPPPGPPRLDDSVLRWLPEILAAAKTTGVPPEIIAAVMRVESTGDPNVISPAGARGLMQAMPDQLYSVGFPDATWHDPASNILAGAWLLINRLAGYGNWNDAIGSYFGFGCDVWGTCTEVYVGVVWSWAAYYAPIIANPLGSGFGILPPDWLPPPVAPYVRPGPPSTATPTPTTPTPTSTSTAENTKSPTPGDDDTTTPTTPPSTLPTSVPTNVPTTVPTQIPTEIPTAVPTAVPTDVPTEPPPPPTEPPPPPPTEVPPPEETVDAGG